jgi:hypothetical protein
LWIAGRGAGIDKPLVEGSPAKINHSPGERANTVLKTWRILRKLRCCPLHAGRLVKAILALHMREAG